LTRIVEGDRQVDSVGAGGKEGHGHPRKRAPIVLAVDIGPASDAAVAVAGRVASSLRARVAVLHVHRPGERSTAAIAPDRRALEELELQGVRAEVMMRGGEPADEILAASRSLGSGLIVIGSRGRSALGGLLLGSVSQEVTARATCPVLVVRAQSSPAPIRNILLAIEGSAGSDSLVETSVKLASALHAAVVVVHISHPGGEQVERAIYHTRDTHGEQAISAAVRRLRSQGVDARPLSAVAVDGISRALARIADSVDAGLILLGARGSARMGGPARTDVSTAVIRRSRRPVVVTREGEEL
jgi:nucleotide-binding universal stress UspA family protein